MDDQGLNWRVNWTEDGERWHERVFCTLGVARAFGNRLVSKHGQDEGFAIYAERMMTVNTCDFMDPMRTAASVGLAPHLQGTANTFGLPQLEGM